MPLLTTIERLCARAMECDYPPLLLAERIMIELKERGMIEDKSDE